MSGSQIELDVDKIGRECLCLQSRMTARAVTRSYNAVLAPIGLEVTEFSLLAALHAGRESSISELADRLVFERTTLVRNLRRMADRGLITPESDEGRAVKYVLTEEGLRLLKEALPVWTAAQASMHERIRPQDASYVLSSLRTLRKAADSR